MSEDVKPRQYFIVESENYNKPPYLDSHRAYHCKQALYENIPVIELEPMLQLMKEIGDILGLMINRSNLISLYIRSTGSISEEFMKEGISKLYEYQCNAEDILEKYRKFLEGIEK